LASTSATSTAERPQTLIINTDRRGPHHVMRAILTGPNGRPQGVSFIVDTGASDVVLPSSMITRLGFEANDLPGLQLQTANGVVSARRGVLKALEIGGGDNREVIERVSVLFISDAATGGTALMGMSVLGRYNMTIEDDEDRIVLARRR
jgi:aspartyl protease family protein